MPIIGCRTDSFPLFYTAESAYPVSYSFDTYEQISNFAKIHWEMEEKGIILANPIPSQDALPSDQIEALVNIAVKEANEKNILGKDATPYPLKRLGELSDGQTKKQ